MSGGTLPKTGLGGFAVTVAGTSVYFGAWQIALIGAVAVGLGITLVRFGWRRNKPIHTP
jgi:hypothetical protein